MTDDTHRPDPDASTDRLDDETSEPTDGTSSNGKGEEPPGDADGKPPRRSDGGAVRRTVKDIDHTHPHTDEPFGSGGVYERGPTSSDEADTDDEPTDEDRRRRGDRDHSPPDGAGAQRVFDRGTAPDSEEK